MAAATAAAAAAAAAAISTLQTYRQRNLDGISGAESLQKYLSHAGGSLSFFFKNNSSKTERFVETAGQNQSKLNEIIQFQLISDFFFLAGGYGLIEE